MILTLTLFFALALCGAVSADDYLGGQPLSTENGTNGTVSGGVYVEAPQYATNTNLDEHTFNLPAGASNDIEWARLYVTVYALNQQTDYGFCATNAFDGNGDGVYETTWTETDHAAFNFIANGGNDNTAYNGSESDPYKIINDHTTRVTSDYFMWYDVTDMITSDTVKVKVDTTGSPCDGRIKMMTLIVAYNDGDNDKIMYWVNQGHDVTSYKTEEQFNTVAVGSTTFNTSSITGTVESANLTVNYLASNNGYYGFPTAENNFEYTGETPPVTGTFTNSALDRTPDAQGGYAGVDSWDVTSYVDGSSDVTLGYSRYFPGTGTSGYFKIPLAILTVNLAAETVDAPVADFTANTTTIIRNNSVQFTDTSTNTPTSWLWDFGDSTTSTLQNPTHTYTTAGTYTVSLTATNEGGSDTETKTGYITAVPNVDLNATGLVNPLPASTVFAGQNNTVTIAGIKNQGKDTATNILVYLYASDVNGGTTPIASTTISSLAAGATASTITLIDPTIRPVTADTVYGASNVAQITYKAVIDPLNTILETNEANNNKTSALKPVLYNGYCGQGLYEYNGTDINTQHVYDICGDIVYYTQPESAYKGVGWTTRTETWNSSNLSVPSTGTIADVWLYLPYNWDYTADGNPNWTILFNGNDITNSALAWYTDQSNFGGYPYYKYGLMVFNVTSMYNRNGDNSLVMTPLSGNLNALYPSTLAVVYSDPTETRKQIFIGEQCDELGLTQSTYGTSQEEATAYANFTGMAIDLANVTSATLHSFAGSAGPGEGNLLFNGNTVALAAWQGTSNTASALVADVKNYLTATGNVAAIQGTTSGGMDTLQQFLVVEYGADLIVTAINPNVGTGAAFFANEPNVLSVTVKNNGTVTSEATTMDVEVNGVTYSVNVPAIAAGASATVTVTDTASHTGGDSVPVNANPNPDRNIPETNTTNNSFSTSFTVYNNGYKGKQYTDEDKKDSIETAQTWEGHYNVIYSSGNTAYNSASWTAKTYLWTSSDLNIPAGATVVSARLYQSYTYNNMTVDPSWIMNFNGNQVDAIAAYKDIKGFGAYNFPYGLYVYDVTSLFNTAGNTMTIMPEAGNTYGIYGAYLIVVYQDPNTCEKKIYINDGFDMLCSRETYSVNDTEATSNSNFQDVNTSNLGNAKAIAILASANEAGKSKFFFNGVEYTGFWNNYQGGPQTGFSTYDVTSALQDGLNTAGMQSYDPTPGVTATYGDNMYVLGSILVAAYGPADLVVSNLQLPSNPVQGTNYTVNATITNNGATNAGSFIVKLQDGTAGVGWNTINSLAAGMSIITSFNWTPAAIGTHTLKAAADYYNTVTESNENNNKLAQDSTVLESTRPDLSISNIELPLNPVVGETYKVNVTVTNNGATDAGSFTVKLQDGTTGIGWITINSLAAQTNTTITFNWKPTTNGTHTLKAAADYYNTVTESNENNNKLAQDITVSTKPDLTISNIELPLNPVVGETYKVNVTVTNNGATDAGSFTVKLQDGTTGIGWITINSLAAQTNTTITFNWKPTTNGTHTLKAAADYYNTIPESNENNNKKTEEIIVT